MQPNNHIIATLNNLIETCKDGERGYWEASEAVTYGFYKFLLRDYARQRAAFVSELQAVVGKLGGKPARKGSVAGNLHREWMFIRAEMQDQQDKKIATECERGDAAALKNYSNALKTNLPTTIKYILEKQRAVILSNSERIHVIANDPTAS